MRIIRWKALTAGMKNEPYCMSFSTGGIFLRESVDFAVLFLELKDWDSVRDKVLQGNLLQARTMNSSKRISSEIISRLKTLNPVEIDFLVHGSSHEQKHLLWLAICRYYKFIADFAVEVIRERYISLKSDLPYEEFDFFFNKKSEYHHELDQIRTSTRAKLRQVLFKILREVDILSENNIIHAAMPSPRLIKAAASANQQDIMVFPAFDSDIKRWLQ